MQSSAAMQFATPLARSAIPASKATLREVCAAAPACSLCHLKERCITCGLDASAMRLLGPLVARRLRFHKGDTLFRSGEKFTSLFVLFSGSCKTVLLGGDGLEQVAGYHMPGDVIGADGIAPGSHDCDAIALEDMEVCRLPFDRVEELARCSTEFQRSLNRLLSLEITRGRQVTRILGTMHADQRLASFLLDLSRRYQDRGYSSVEFVLRMTREEIGSYLGLKLETVSRLFSRFHEEGLIQVRGRVVKLLDRGVLRMIVENEFVRAAKQCPVAIT